MNIFVLHENPIEAARLVPVKVASKMALEAAQMLAVACYIHKMRLPHKKDGDYYSHKNHKDHPCTKWVCQSKANMKWTLEYAKELCVQHFNFFNKMPAQMNALNEVLGQMYTDVDSANHTPFYLEMPDEFKTDDVVESYRTYIKTKPYYVEGEVQL